jgi:hypothetical protein
MRGDTVLTGSELVVERTQSLVAAQEACDALLRWIRRIFVGRSVKVPKGQVVSRKQALDQTI